MPNSADDLEDRLALLEREVARLREQVVLASSDAGAARVLAAGADHDVAEVRAELRAHTMVLNALRETQLEQGQTLQQHSQLLQQHSQLLQEHGQLLQEHGQKMSDGFSTLNVGMAQITVLLKGIAES